jgi:hypothetical protein
MPVAVYLGLLGGVIAAAGLTLALAQGAGVLAFLAPVALVLAWLVRRR